jgi:acetoin:2,6-dichlorophenolindophenol oxidoreductase subunit alpha
MTRDRSADLYRTIRLIRRFEERAIELVRSGDISGGIHPCIGQEAVPTGCCAALRAGDLVTTTHRGHGHALAKGADPGLVLAELAGRETGLNRGRGGSMHLTDTGRGVLGAAAGIVGAGQPIAAGAAWAARRLRTDQVVLSFLGDGAVNQGVFFEALNLAALWRLPVVFVCENNGYATTLPAAAGIAGSITGRAAAFGIESSIVDGMDAELVLAAATAAVDRARAGRGPAFLECRTYRFDVHHTRDYLVRLRYRTDEEIERWRARDPVRVQAARLDTQTRTRIDEEVETTVADAVRFALAAPLPDPAAALDHLYATGLTPRMGVA